MLYNTCLNRLTDKGGRILYFKFFDNTFTMRIYSWNANKKFIRYFGIGKTFGNQLQHFFLTPGNNRLLWLWFA